MGFVDFLPLIGTGVNAIADLLGMDSQAHYQRVNQRESAKLQHDENVYWAEYNTPANQMARLKAAGLNPNLVYGNGADAQFSGSVSPSGSMPSMRGGYGTDYLTARNMIEQNKNLQAQNEMYTNLANKYSAEAEGINLDNRKKAAGIPEYQAWLENKSKWDSHLNSVSEREKNHAQALLFDAQRDLAMIDTKIQKEFGYSIKEEVLNQALLETQILEMEKANTPRKLRAEYNLSVSETNKAAAAIANLRALSSLYEQQTRNEQGKYTLQDKHITEQHIKNQILSLERDIKAVEADIKSSGYSKFWEKWIGSPAGAIGKIFSGSASMRFK